MAELSIRQLIMRSTPYQSGDAFALSALSIYTRNATKSELHGAVFAMVAAGEMVKTKSTKSGNIYQRRISSDLLRRPWVKWHPPEEDTYHGYC